MFVKRSNEHTSGRNTNGEANQSRCFYSFTLVFLLISAVVTVLLTGLLVLDYQGELANLIKKYIYDIHNHETDINLELICCLILDFKINRDENQNWLLYVSILISFNSEAKCTKFTKFKTFML